MCILLRMILMHFIRKYREIDRAEVLEEECAGQTDGVLIYPDRYELYEERKVS